MSTPRTLLDNAAQKLPSPNGVALAIMELWDDEEVSIEQLSQLVKSDPALSGRLLRLANSAATGTLTKVSSISAAIVKVGMKTVGQLAVAFSLIDQYLDDHCQSFDYNRFWLQCVLMALICRGLGQQTALAPPDNLFSCALMMRIGLLAFATIYPDEYSSLLDSEPEDLTVAERDQFGFDHNELSLEMLLDFGVAEDIAGPARFHERPDVSGLAEKSHDYKLAQLFHLGYRLSDSVLRVGLQITQKRMTTWPQVRRFGLTADQIAEVLEESATEWEDWSQLLRLPAPEGRPPPSATESTPNPVELREPQPDRSTATQALLDSALNVVLISSAGEAHPLNDTLSELNVVAWVFEDQKEMLRRVLELRPHLIIMDDYGRDDLHAKRDKLCRLIRSTEWGRSIYIMALFGDNEHHRISEAFRSGIDAAYLLSELSSQALDARLEAVRRAADQHFIYQKDRVELRRIANQLALSQRRAEVLSLTDELTELPNRRSALEDMAQAWQKETHLERPMSVIMIDIDHFKRINDTFGHAAGDKVLVEVAAILKQDLGQQERVYRVGGEEFLYLSNSSSFKQLILNAERLRRRVAALDIRFQNQPMPVTISLGVAQRSEEHARFDMLLVHADQALYAAKTVGRNCINVYRNQQIVALPRPGG
ncbi:MAG: diguanylate cyclase [Lamprobacter sp.]|uniref:sensor domain-containing diguanylate cyclase n=1 Tax=Lamprobacter sp. TaxID=3100796 RepID=UPI002B25851B|nr:diguanylate cyclase [Lamprobacter sp.]MEA3639069.1 diguanylate cyclase [Lamprobacter sp.]